MDFKTVTSSEEFEYKVLRSLFIGSAKSVFCEEEASQYIYSRTQIHKNASHNCWAYILNPASEGKQYFSDAGEPSGTAGKHILGAMLSQSLSNCALVVTRYFGGKKLGIRGLIDAYSFTASETLKKSKIHTYSDGFLYKIESSYPLWDKVLYGLRKIDLFPVQKSVIYEEKIYAEILIPESLEVEAEELFKELEISKQFNKTKNRSIFINEPIIKES